LLARFPGKAFGDEDEEDDKDEEGDVSVIRPLKCYNAFYCEKFNLNNQWPDVSLNVIKQSC
jgi:hypothetical protein